MKYFLTIFTYAIIAAGVYANGYDMKLPVEGSSIANDTLQFNVMQDIYKRLSKKNPACFNYSITDTQIVQYPYDVKIKDGNYIKGYWKELWTIDVCSKKVQVPVSYSIKSNSTAYKVETKFFSE